MTTMHIHDSFSLSRARVLTLITFQFAPSSLGVLLLQQQIELSSEHSADGSISIGWSNRIWCIQPHSINLPQLYFKRQVIPVFCRIWKISSIHIICMPLGIQMSFRCEDQRAWQGDQLHGDSLYACDRIYSMLIYIKFIPDMFDR